MAKIVCVAFFVLIANTTRSHASKDRIGTLEKVIQAANEGKEPEYLVELNCQIGVELTRFLATRPSPINENALLYAMWAAISAVYEQATDDATAAINAISHRSTQRVRLVRWLARSPGKHLAIAQMEQTACMSVLFRARQATEHFKNLLISHSIDRMMIQAERYNAISQGIDSVVMEVTEAIRTYATPANRGSVAFRVAEWIWLNNFLKRLRFTMAILYRPHNPSGELTLANPLYDHLTSGATLFLDPWMLQVPGIRSIRAMSLTRPVAALLFNAVSSPDNLFLTLPRDIIRLILLRLVQLRWLALG